MRKPALSIALAILLASCASDPRPAPFQVDYSSYGKISLDVAKISFLDRNGGALSQPPYIDAQFSPTIPDALRRWQTDRLQATGVGGEAMFIVKEGSLTEEDVPVKSGMREWFTRQQAYKYSGRVSVEIDAHRGGDYGLASAEASYSVTLPEDPTEKERQDAYRQLLDGLMGKLNANLDQSIHDHFGSFLRGPAR